MNNNKTTLVLDDSELGPLSNLNIVELRRLWRKLNGNEPQTSINRSLLIKRIAYRAQEPACGAKSANRGLLARVAQAAGR
jgi:Protein of unknown function (DUF2924)